MRLWKSNENTNSNDGGELYEMEKIVFDDFDDGFID